jgi:hypothetical protein
MLKLYSRAKETSWYWAVAAAVPAVAVTAAGLLIADRTISNLGTVLWPQMAPLIQISQAQPLSDPNLLLHIQLVVAAFFVSFLVPILGIVIACRMIVSLHLRTRQALAAACLLSVLVLMALHFLSSAPLYEKMAGPLFEATIKCDLALTRLDALFGWRVDTLDWLVTLSNGVFIVAASFLLFAVSALDEEFRAFVAVALFELPIQTFSIQKVRVFAYRIRTLLVAAALITSCGILNMTVWRFWPVAYLEDWKYRGLRTAYLGVAEGSVIVQGVVFSAILVAIFFRPFATLNDVLNSYPVVYDDLAKSQVFSHLLARVRDMLLPLAPVATGIVAIILG